MLTFWKEAIEELQKRELENSSECDFLGETTLKTPGEQTSLFHYCETRLSLKQIWLQVSTWKITLECAARCISTEKMRTNYTLSPNRHTNVGVKRSRASLHLSYLKFFVLWLDCMITFHCLNLQTALDTTFIVLFLTLEKELLTGFKQ